MGLEDFTSEGDGGSSNITPASERTSSGSKGGTYRGGHQWVTKLDFSKPYVVVAEDKTGRVFASKGDLKVIKDRDDWKRLEEFNEMEDPPNQVRVLFERSSLGGWLRFCNLSIDQGLGDPNELLKECPEELHFIEDQIYYPPGRINEDRTCQVCGADDSDKEVAIVQMKLRDHTRLNVCASHTVEELAENGFLQ